VSELDKDWILGGSGDSPASKSSTQPDPVPEQETALLEDGWLIPAAPTVTTPAGATPVEPDAESDGDQDHEDDEEWDEDEDRSAGPDPSELLRKARFMLDLDRPKDALKALQELVDWYPDHHEGWCEVARAFHSLSDKERALRAADLAIQADAYSAGGYDWKCRLQLHDDEWKAALATAETGSEMTYRDAQVERWKVRAWLAGEKRDAAKQYLEQNPGLPEDAEMAYVRGEIARQAEEFQQADWSFRRAIQLEPGTSEAWAGLSSVLVHEKRHADAVTCIHRAVQLEPGRPDIATRAVEVIDAYVGQKVWGLSRYGIWAMVFSVICTPGLATLLIFPLGLLWFLVTRPVDRHQRERALSTLPRDIRDYYQTHQTKGVRSTWAGLGCLLGIILSLVGGIAVLAALFTSFGWDGALRVLLLVGIAGVALFWKLVIDAPDQVPEVRFRFPGDPYVAEDLEEGEEAEEDRGAVPDWEPSATWAGWQLLHDGNAAGAQEKARAALSGDPEDVEALLLYSTASLQLGEFEPGLAAAKSAASHDPEETRAPALMWAHLAASGRLEEAVAAASEDRSTADDAGDYLVWLIRCQFRSGTHATARAISELVQRLYPGSAEPHEVEGDWAFETGRWADSEAAYRRALALEPESASLHSSLAWTLERRCRFGQARESARRALLIDAEDENGKTVLVRQAAAALVCIGVLLATALSLCATVPTLMGYTTNRWIVAATLLGPLLASGAVFLSQRPLLRKMAPGLLFELGPWELMDPRLLAFVSSYGALTIGLTVQSIQAWSEIGLHRELIAHRWPGAALVTGLGAVLWLGVGRLVAYLRR